MLVTWNISLAAEWREFRDKSVYGETRVKYRDRNKKNSAVNKLNKRPVHNTMDVNWKSQNTLFCLAAGKGNVVERQITKEILKCFLSVNHINSDEKFQRSDDRLSVRHHDVTSSHCL
jgi:hypothetical protein